jgi:energy-coupling factor transporter ATP-binding protein EcfA2
VSTAASCRPADNPFATHRVEHLPYSGWALSGRDLERRIDALGGKVALVGPKGSGKTTLLEELSDRLERPTVLVRIQGSDPRPYRTAIRQLPDPVTPLHTILIDSAGQLGTLGWRHFLTRTDHARRLVATLHRPGRLPALLNCTTDLTLLRRLVRELAPAQATVLDSTLDDLFRRHDGNIRACLRELYDVCAGRKTTATGQTA